LAIQHDIAVTVIPGPTAFIDALVVSGKPAHEFYFAGFLPQKKVSRQNRLRDLSRLKSTLVFYESCHRIIAALEDIQEIFGAKEIVVARELTKKFEEISRGEPALLLEKLKIEGHAVKL